MASVPLLKHDSIISFIYENWRLKLTKDDLKRPTAQILLRIYEHFLSDFQINVEAFRQPILSLKPQDEFSNIELHELSIPTAHFFNSLKFLLMQAGLNDFCLTDIIKPDMKRTRRIICHLINFWRFFAKREAASREVIQDYKNIGDLKHVKEMEINALKQELNNCYSHMAEQENEVQEDRKTLKANLDDVEKCKIKAAMLQKQKGDYRLNTAELENKLASLDVEIAEKSQQLQILEGKIIRSPNRLLAEREVSKKKLQTLQGHYKELQNRFTGKCLEEKKYYELSIEVKNLEGQFEAIVIEIAKLRTLEEKNDQLTKMKELVNKEIADIDDNKTEAEKLCRFQEESCGRFRLNFNKRYEPLEEAMQECQKELKLAKEKCVNADYEFKSLQISKAKLEKQLEEIAVNKKRANNEFIALKSKLFTQFEEIKLKYVQEVKEVLKELSTLEKCLKEF